MTATGLLQNQVFLGGVGAGSIRKEGLHRFVIGRAPRPNENQSTRRGSGFSIGISGFFTCSSCSSTVFTRVSIVELISRN